MKTPWLGFITPARATLLAVCAACFIAVFWRWFWAQHLFTQEKLQDWGHAYLIPLISGYLLYLKRHELAAVRPTTFWPGLAPLTLGILAYFFGIVGIPNHMVQGFSMILALFGLVLLLGGPEVMRYAFLPIAFLAFGVTLPERVMIAIEFQLQLISAQGGWIVLSLVGPLFGFSATISGNTIEIIESSNGAIHTMGIAEACSGMRMVIAFVALAGAVALLGCDRWWQRTALVLLAIPVAVFMNIIRIGVLGVGMLWDDQIATGDVHIFIGTVLLVPALGLFMLVRVGLDRLFVDEKPAKAVKKKAPAPAYLGEGWSALRSPAFVTSALVLGICAASMTWAIYAWGIIYKKYPIQAPNGRTFMQAGEERLRTWEVKKTVRENHETEETLGTQNYLTAVYECTEPPYKGLHLSFHGAYYTGKIDTVPHIPERCLVGAGWSIAEDPKTIELPLNRSEWAVDNDDAAAKAKGIRKAPIRRTNSLTTSYVRMPEGVDKVMIQVTKFKDPTGKEQFSGYFFVANGKIATTAEEVRLKAFDLTTRYAFYAKIQVTSWTATSAEEFAAQAGSLVSELLPEVMLCVPDWVEVEAGRYPKDNAGDSTPEKKKS